MQATLRIKTNFGAMPLSKAELEKVVGGAKDPSWRPGGTAGEKSKVPGSKPKKAADIPKTLTEEERTAGLKMKVGTEVFASREEALAQIKRDLGIPRCQEPIRQEMVLLRDEFDNPILDESNNLMHSRQLIYSVENQFDTGGRPITEVIIQDHSYGHEYSNAIGNQMSHYNVRPSNNPKNGKVQGLREHYYFDYRNRK